VAIIAFAILVAAYTMLPANLVTLLNGALNSGISYLASLRGVQVLALGWSALLTLLGLFFVFTPRYQAIPT
jgi:hypothetical protein